MSRILLVFILLLFTYIQVNTIEAFTTKHFVLVGDSMLKNDSYVEPEHNITQLLKQENYQVTCLAKDNALVGDMSVSYTHLRAHET